jgi:hypothetical protein
MSIEDWSEETVKRYLDYVEHLDLERKVKSTVLQAKAMTLLSESTDYDSTTQEDLK